MKIAVLSDIHGNLPALQTATQDIEAWQPDLVVVDGDIVNRGPLSLDCLEFVQAKQRTADWRVVRGNHEDYLLACDRPDAPRCGPEYELWRFAFWAHDQLNGHLAVLQTLPNQFSWTAPDGSEFRVVHASMRNNRDGIYADSSDEVLYQQIAPVPGVFVTAHTHRPLIRRFNDSLVVNVGSVGAPFDRDTRASYGRFTWTHDGWQSDIIRLPYDIAQTERDYVESGFLDEAGPLAQLMLVELRRAGGLIYRWAKRYQDAVLAEEIDLAESVRELLHDEDLRPFLGAPGWTL
ncbi:MAG: metallophosphoesterase family protein [Chloroflexi bacterium]|jgi:putative phosphoesterase|nr:metallophosphoesterase family protein [Chloroflexota bacterium]MBK6709427.1 metallophosphoesterase family protein [Chloroflexota bacterium]MBK7177663.1 metallophosphoesterase family protein [Chloroflexota bacterium]MBK7915196.1 metallophosphoesterase family protein [Chloroflexota bacterium]MBK8935612.1 metallophosphoesterase family protein [Chloroflexota bacterium]